MTSCSKSVSSKSWQLECSIAALRVLPEAIRSALGALDALDQLADLDGILGLPPRQQRRLIDHVGQLGAAETCGNSSAAC